MHEGETLRQQVERRQSPLEKRIENEELNDIKLEGEEP